MPKIKLIPPDKKHCQTIKTLGSAWQIGNPIREERCNKTTSHIIREVKAPHGSMGVCKECLVVAKRQLGSKITARALPKRKFRKQAK